MKIKKYIPKEKANQQKVFEPFHENEYQGTHQGTGGRLSSQLQKKDEERPAAPKVGAQDQRSMRVSDFRKYYDRGDLPIKVNIKEVSIEQYGRYHQNNQTIIIICQYF